MDLRSTHKEKSFQVTTLPLTKTQKNGSQIYIRSSELLVKALVSKTPKIQSDTQADSIADVAIRISSSSLGCFNMHGSEHKQVAWLMTLFVLPFQVNSASRGS